MALMNVTSESERETDGEKGAQSSRPEKLNLAKQDTALARQINDYHAMWLIDHVTRRWEELHGNLQPWREKMAKYERQSEGDYSDRLHRVNKDDASKKPDVFSYLNESLGTSEGFVDFFTAQATDDVFGSDPWLTATPQGKADIQLAESITRHASWKLGQSDLEATIRDAIRIAAWGGTSFVKPRWVRKTEPVSRIAVAAHSITTGQPYLNANGQHIEDEKDFPEDQDGADVEWIETLIDDEVVCYDNVCNSCLDYKDVAFKTTAQRLDLDHTDFYVRFRMGLLDVVNEYEIPLEKAENLKGQLIGWSDSARLHRDENDRDDENYDQNNENPIVELVEGYLRCDILNNGRPIRIHVIFSPTLRTLFSIDYLYNASPGGILPVFPIRVHKIANRIMGIGYLEKYELKNDSVDRKHNIVSLRARKSAHVWTTIQPDALKDPEQANITADPDKPIELAEGKSMNDFMTFSNAPDLSNGLISLRDAEMQMMQMQSGITSAAQGELKGVPSANTATGTQQILSRGATLLKNNIDPLTTDIEKIVEYDVHLIYANQDQDETFMWGEGQEAELMEIKAGDVKGLRTNVTLTMVTSQNQKKLETAQAGIGILQQYLAVPETEKPTQRKLYVQALSTLGFRDAEDIVRQATIDPMGIMAIIPPEYAPFVEQALVQAGLMQPTTAPTEEGQEASPQPEQY